MARQYKDLYALISFEGFRWDHHIEDEVRILQPRMEEHGFKDIEWFAGETDEFGPLSRVVRATAGDETVWFVYG